MQILFFSGALDKTILIWKVPQQLISQSNLIDSLRHKKKMVSHIIMYILYIYEICIE